MKTNPIIELNTDNIGWRIALLYEACKLLLVLKGVGTAKPSDEN